MFKTHIKQSFQMLKQNKFVSAISIIGTALAIMMIMVLIITEQVKTINIAPEDKRDRTLYISLIERNGNTNGWMDCGPLTYPYIKKYLFELETPELVTAIADDSSLIEGTSDDGIFSAPLKYVDANYWKIMSFDFVQGRPFDQAEFEAGMKYAVISESLAEKAFGKEDALGKTIKLYLKPYTVIGVVKDVPLVFRDASSDIWISYSSIQGYEEGYFYVLMLASSKKDFSKIREEIAECERQHNNSDDEWRIDFQGPLTHRGHTVAEGTLDEEHFVLLSYIKMILIFLVLLLIPAFNLSGISLSRVKKRTEEIGIRKAFGAKRSSIVFQILYENLLTSLIGGVIGLILSYFAVLWLKDWLLGIKDINLGIAGVNTIPLEAFISWPVFISVFLVCILLNTISTIIPARNIARLNIVDSLNQNNE